MTAACLMLLHETQNPLWPWEKPYEPGLLVEAFPAAQLCHWGLKHQGYDGNKEGRQSNRERLVASVSKLVDIPDISLRKKMEQCADALDAVLCTFAAIAVSTNRLSRPAMPSDEGEIAVHEHIEEPDRSNMETVKQRPAN
jgi:hypothetical protein